MELPMNRYNVIVTYRKDDGMSYATPTDTAEVHVEADDHHQARQRAIDEAYSTFDPCSHVSVRHVCLTATGVQDK
jgi:hypothetical protein